MLGWVNAGPLVTEVGDDLQPPAEGFDVGGERPEFCRACNGVLDRGDAPWVTPMRAATSVWMIRAAEAST